MVFNGSSWQAAAFNMPCPYESGFNRPTQRRFQQIDSPLLSTELCEIISFSTDPYHAIFNIASRVKLSTTILCPCSWNFPRNLPPLRPNFLLRNWHRQGRAEMPLTRLFEKISWDFPGKAPLRRLKSLLLSPRTDREAQKCR
jgi:hypothetical protein